VSLGGATSRVRGSIAGPRKLGGWEIRVALMPAGIGVPVREAKLPGGPLKSRVGSPAPSNSPLARLDRLANRNGRRCAKRDPKRRAKRDPSPSVSRDLSLGRSTDPARHHAMKAAEEAGEAGEAGRRAKVPVAASGSPNLGP
jgi:hypothetical protein